MISITIPGYKKLQLKHIVLDYNGTLAFDGQIIKGVKKCLGMLSDKLKVHVLTANTFGKAGSMLEGVSCELSTLPVDDQHIGKLDYVKQLGSEHTVCIGNGRNDRMMLKESALGIAVVLGEGAAMETLLSSDVICTDIVSALELLANPLRLIATLRS